MSGVGGSASGVFQPGPRTVNPVSPTLPDMSLSGFPGQLNAGLSVRWTAPASWSTAARPPLPLKVGTFGFNTDLQYFEFFDGTQWLQWSAVTSGPRPALVITGDSPPASPTVGVLWFDTTGGLLYMWYDDGNTQQWVNVNNYNAPSPAIGAYLPLSGGTMTGPLTGTTASFSGNLAGMVTSTGSTTSRLLADRWKDFNDVRDFGTVQDGTTSDQTALTSAFNATPALGTIYVPPGNINFGTFAPTSKSVLWRFNGSYTGSGTTPIPSVGNNVFENMLPTWTKYLARGSSVGITNMGPVYRVDMVLNHAGGTTGGVPAVQVNAQTTAGSTLSEAPYGLVASLTMGSTQTGGSVGTALAGYAVKSLGAGNASPFGGNFYADDQTGLSSGSGGSAVGAEIDVKANKLDDGVLADGYNINNSVASPGSNRAVLALQYGRSNRSDNTAMEVSTILQMGLFSTPIDGAYCSAKNAIKVQGTISFAGLNFLHASFNAGAQAIAMQNEQTVGWTTAASTSVPTSWNYLQYTTTGGNRLRYMATTNERFAVTDAGAVMLPALPGTASYANDAAAATGGVAIGQLYRNGSAVMVRVT